MKYRYYSRSKTDRTHLYRVDTETGRFYCMDHCWTGEGIWYPRREPVPGIVEISEERAMEISVGTLYTAQEVL